MVMDSVSVLKLGIGPLTMRFVLIFLRLRLWVNIYHRHDMTLYDA